MKDVVAEYQVDHDRIVDLTRLGLLENVPSLKIGSESQEAFNHQVPLGVGILRLDQHRCITESNQEAEQLLGYTSKELHGQEIDRFFLKDLAEKFRRDLHYFAEGPAINQSPSMPSTFVLAKKDGSSCSVRSLVTTYSESGEPTYTLMLHTDTKTTLRK